MAEISIKVGPLLVTKNYADDAKAGAAIQAFYLDQQLGPPGAPNRDIIEAVITWFVRQLTAKASQRHVQTKDAEARAEAATLYGLEP
jgi:hypothetical protein